VAAAGREGRIGLVAALASTLGPSRALLESAGAGPDQVVDLPCLDAWPLFEAGDLPGYHQRVMLHVESVGPSFDVVVLAQASMAPVSEMLDIGIPILSSPRLAVEAARRRLR
jgi:hypothetical protein